MKWSSWVDDLRCLPADAPEWLRISEFIQIVEQLAEQKRLEREAPRNRLRQALATLVSLTSELEFFGIKEADRWTADACPLAETNILADQAEELLDSLTIYRNLRQQFAADLAGERQRRKDLDDLEKKIVRVLSALASFFGTLPSPEKPSLRPEEQTPEKKEPEAREEEPPGREPAAEEMVLPESHVGVEVATEGPPVVEQLESKAALMPPERVEGAPPEGRLDAGREEVTAPQLGVSEEPVSVPVEKETLVSLPSPAVLCPSHEAATVLKTNDCDENWHALVWALVAEDDLPAAYWVTRSLAAARRSVPAPDWLLAALQGARWLLAGTSGFANHLRAIGESNHPRSEGAEAMLGLAAALNTTLVAPHIGLSGWLATPDCCPSLHDLVGAVRDFTNLGIELRPEDLRGVTGAEEREAAVVAAASEASRWLRESSGRRLKIRRATVVWQHLVGPNGELQSLLDAVCGDRRDRVETVSRNLEEWEKREYVSRQIDRIDRELHQPKRKPIVGAPRNHLVRGIQEACTLARNWCRLVEQQRKIETRGKWVFEQIEELRNTVRRSLPSIRKELAQLTLPCQPASKAASARCLERAVNGLSETLELQDNLAETESRRVGLWDWFASETEDLVSALARRLLWIPEISLEDNGSPTENELLRLAPVLAAALAERRELQDALKQWLQKQDFRFVSILLSAMAGEAFADDLEISCREARERSKRSLQDEIEKTENEIEQALVDGIISVERSEYAAEVEAVKGAESLNFGEMQGRLQSVRERLSRARQSRLAELRSEWEKTASRLESVEIASSTRERIREFVTVRLNCGDTRVVEECLAHLAEVLDAGGGLEESLFEVPTFRDYLDEFKRQFHAQPRRAEESTSSRLDEWLKEGLKRVATDVREGRKRGGLNFGDLPTPRREEAAKAIEAWQELRQRKAGHPKNQDLIAVVLRFLGFDFGTFIGSPIETVNRGPDWLHVRAAMSASHLARPIPQFGSQSHGRYDIVCLWERPAADTIAARLGDRQLGAQCVIVFYLGRLTERQRRDVVRVSREQELAVAVLDELLLVFLAGERDARLPVFLRCSLPFAALNPYTPFQAGDVPPEMFFGRDAMAKELQRPGGSCIVYGGRQLGKSALLRHVQRQFHNPKIERYAWVENMKIVFEPAAGKGTENVWRVLRDEFKAAGLLSGHITTEKSEKIFEHLLETMRQLQERRVLVMFDEADEFLRLDAEEDFPNTVRLRELMLKTDHRFKVVFCGLHNVQRFQGIPNQPLAHFGTPLCVGPLEPRAAQELVRQPLETLGYRFKDDTTVLRILSYTNYHPGLIQLFCQELLKRLNARVGNLLPPYEIQQGDVEDIYRLRDVRERIRERLDWTLALHAPYQAIVWALIVDQMEMRDSYAQAYSPGKILDLVHSWWPEGFADTGTDQIRSSLDELCGLGVLVRNKDGHYRLRSPNLVRLMGTEEDIENRLLELSEKRPETVFDADSYHAVLDDAGQKYSPMTFAEERRLNLRGSGVGLVFASAALRYELLPEVFKRFVPPASPEDKSPLAEIPSSLDSAEQFYAWLEAHMDKCAMCEKIVVYHRPRAEQQENLQGMVKEALEFCRRHQSSKRSIIILFLFHPVLTDIWLRLPVATRQEIEDQAVLAFPRRWNKAALRRRLAQHDKMDSEEVCQSILKATGGWPILVDEVFSRCQKEIDPRPFAESVACEMKDKNSDLNRKFNCSLGIEEKPVARKVLRFMLDYGAFFESELSEVAKLAEDPETGIQKGEFEQTVEYLLRLQCIERSGGKFSVENVLGTALFSPS